jgi:hypothetical protein
MGVENTTEQERPVYEKPTVRDYGTVQELTAARTILGSNTDIPRHGSFQIFS